MKILFQLLLIVGVMGAFSTAEAKRVKVTPKKYTCQQLHQLLDKHGSIWVRGFLGFYNNVAFVRPKCSGAFSSHPDRVCRSFTRRVRAKDGRCSLAPAKSCTCEVPHSDDDD